MLSEDDMKLRLAEQHSGVPCQVFKKITCGITLTLVFSLVVALKAQDIYVANFGAGSGNGSIGQYDLNGQAVNTSLITNVYHPIGIAVSGTNLYVVNYTGLTLGEYTTSGATISTNLISALYDGGGGIAVSGTNLFVGNQYGIGEYGLDVKPLNADLIPGVAPMSIAISGTNLFVVNANEAETTVGEYTTSGATVNANLITNLDHPLHIAILGTNLFITRNIGQNGIIGEYTTSGAIINTNLISGLNDEPYGIAVSGTNLFVANYENGTVGEYTTSGATVNTSLISGLLNPWAIAFGPAPPGPQLNITAVGNQSVLFYPPWDTNYVLQYVTNLASTNWLPVANWLTVSNGVTVTNNLPASFFRLAPAN